MCINIFIYTYMCGFISIHKNMCVCVFSILTSLFFFSWLTQHAGSHLWSLNYHLLLDAQGLLPSSQTRVLLLLLLVLGAFKFVLHLQ